MACTTILVGKNATYDGSCMIARNDDSAAGSYTAKKCVVVHPQEQPKKYESVISHVIVDLPENPMRYTAVPNAVEGEGIWAACGVNEAGVGMSATETITSNPRVLGADPLVVYDPQTQTPGGIGEEDFVVLVLPYICSAKEGVLRLGSLLEKYGTYEMNGIAFSDADEIWWMETIGGHHWIARKVPDDVYVAMPNQFGMDTFDLEDALGKQENYCCSKDLKDFIDRFHLDLSFDSEFDPRATFGSHDDADHVYNTPRAWYIEKVLNPHTKKWEGEGADYTPESDDLPWCMSPEKKITVEDVKYVLSSTFQGTPYDPYKGYGDRSQAGMYRSIGVNRTSFLGLIQHRPDKEILEWIAFASNAFNVMIPFYPQVSQMPAYVANTTAEVTTENFYWTSRMIAAMADASYKQSRNLIERYQNKVAAKAHEIVYKTDEKLKEITDPSQRQAICEAANEEICAMARECAQDTLGKVLFALSEQMKNAYARSDA